MEIGDTSTEDGVDVPVPVPTGVVEFPYGTGDPDENDPVPVGKPDEGAVPPVTGPTGVLAL